MRCENCRNEVSDGTIICPYCGANLQPGASPNIGYANPGQYQPGSYQQPGFPPQQAGGYQQPGYQQQMYQQPAPGYGYPGINVTVVNNPVQTNTAPLIVEVILSIFGIYGVGWLMSGETTVGVILLICSFVIYWPVAIFTIILTLGICWLPIGVAAIVVNAILLNNKLKQRAVMMPYMPPPAGPQYPRY